MSDNYWRDQTARRQADALAALENARAANLRDLSSALADALEDDRVNCFMEAEERDKLYAAQQVVNELRRVW